MDDRPRGITPSIVILAAFDPSLIGARFALEQDRVTVGRRADITISDIAISRVHATFQRNGDAWTIEDTLSTSGTYLNDERFSGPAPLKDGDVIRLGRVVVKFESHLSGGGS